LRGSTSLLLSWSVLASLFCTWVLGRTRRGAQVPPALTGELEGRRGFNLSHCSMSQSPWQPGL
uniref:Uncharacterized protein n=1 Tax=Chelonoidis abingdonii TaxID=106734 RepID=A0A8C0IV43_CHEAB